MQLCTQSTQVKETPGVHSWGTWQETQVGPQCSCLLFSKLGQGLQRGLSS